MPIGAQPRRARGTVGHPYSALNLRLLLASFGLVTCAVLATLLWRGGYRVGAGVLGLLAAVALIDLIVIQRRRRRRRRDEAGGNHSVFE